MPLHLPSFELATLRTDVVEESGALRPEQVKDLLEVSQVGTLFSPVDRFGGVGGVHGFSLSVDTANHIFSSFVTNETFWRKALAAERAAILSENHQALVWGRIGAVYKDADTIANVRKFMSVTYNLAIDVVKRSAVAFRTGMRRSIEGAGEDEEKAFQAIIEQGLLTTLAQKWSQSAFFEGPVTVVPTVRGDQMLFEAHLPHQYDIVQDPENPDGTPLAIAYPLRRMTGEDGQHRSEFQVVLDGHSWRVFNGKDEVEELEVVHGLGVFPGETLRTDIDFNGSWWAPTRHQRLVDATLDISVIDAAMGWIRKAQNKHLLMMIGHFQDGGEGQTQHPEKGLLVPTPDQNRLRAEVFNFDTDPVNFERQIRMKERAIFAAYDIPPAAGLETTESNTNSVAAASNEALTERRAEQIGFARSFDKALMLKMVKMATAMNHPLAGDLPDEEKFREAYTVDFGLVSRDFADPVKQIAWDDKQVARGHESNLSLLLKANPGLSEKRAQEVLDKRLEEQIAFNALAAARDMTKEQPDVIPGAEPENASPAQVSEPSATMTAAEIFGRSGPQIRKQNQAAKQVDA